MPFKSICNANTCRAMALCGFAMLPTVTTASDVRFASPTGNIVCNINAFVAACQIREFIPSFTTPPEDCDGSWGSYFFVLTRGAAKLGCVSEDIGNAGNILAYGDAVVYPQVTCISRTTGMTCTNSEGRGFTIRRVEQRIF